MFHFLKVIFPAALHFLLHCGNKLVAGRCDLGNGIEVLGILNRLRVGRPAHKFRRFIITSMLLHQSSLTAAPVLNNAVGPAIIAPFAGCLFFLNINKWPFKQSSHDHVCERGKKVSQNLPQGLMLILSMD